MEYHLDNDMNGDELSCFTGPVYFHANDKSYFWSTVRSNRFLTAHNC